MLGGPPLVSGSLQSRPGWQRRIGADMARAVGAAWMRGEGEGGEWEKEGEREDVS